MIRISLSNSLKRLLIVFVSYSTSNVKSTSLNMVNLLDMSKPRAANSSLCHFIFSCFQNSGSVGSLLVLIILDIFYVIQFFVVLIKEFLKQSDKFFTVIVIISIFFCDIFTQFRKLSLTSST